MLKLKMFINGEWLYAADQETCHMINPANKEVIAEATRASVEETRDAIDAARNAFDSGIWSDLPASEKASYLFKIADKLEENAAELSALEMSNVGKPLREAEFDVADAVDCFRYYGDLVTKPNDQTYTVSDPVQGLIVREPVGVCGY